MEHYPCRDTHVPELPSFPLVSKTMTTHFPVAEPVCDTGRTTRQPLDLLNRGYVPLSHIPSTVYHPPNEQRKAGPHSP